MPISHEIPGHKNCQNPTALLELIKEYQRIVEANSNLV